MFDIPCIPTSASEPDSQSPSSSPAAAAKPQSAEPATLRSAAGLLALQTLPAIGEQTALRLALLANEADPLPGEHAQLWARGMAEVEEEIERCKATGIAVISIFDSAYPERLRAIASPPPVLYVRGEVGALQRQRAVALAGSREPSEAGLAATAHIVAALAESDWTVIAGLGKGVEAAAHLAALSAGATTVAVMPTGLDHIVPVPNRALAGAIVEAGGALVSPFRMELKASRSTTATRGRIIAGLAAALIVSQAAADDGAMYSARDAASQGRPVLCPQPRPDVAEDEGLRNLLEAPASQLPGLLTAWKGKSPLATRLGDRPLARPLAPDDGPAIRAALDEAIAAEPQAGFEPSWTLPKP
ncbi:MAG TPA: DNA-processing protein DprA [Solirubrobacterales bacterium]|nr:DNA-processing protein DprA [Solirubrobacterales bacterium]